MAWWRANRPQSTMAPTMAATIAANSAELRPVARSHRAGKRQLKAPPGTQVAMPAATIDQQVDRGPVPCPRMAGVYSPARPSDRAPRTMPKLPTDAIPAAEFLVRHLYRPISVAA